MKKDEKIMNDLWNLFNKKIWLEKEELKEQLKGYTPSEVHTIEYIENAEDPNVTKLADYFYVTRSAMSKITTKLINKKLIERYQKAENKKEIYFQLTEKGKSIYNMHENLHQKFQQRDKKIFDNMSDEQFKNIIMFTEEYNKHLENEIQNLGVDAKSGNLDNF